MPFAIVVLLILGVFVAYSTYLLWLAKKQRLAYLRTYFGKPPANVDYELGSISSYTNRIGNAPNRIDGITWNDLDMNNVYKRINVCLSSIGEEYLYNYLHETAFSNNKLLCREDIISFLEANPDKLLEIQKCLHSLGKRNYNGISDFIFEGEKKKIAHHLVYKIFAVLPILFCGALIFDIRVGTVGIVMSFIVNFILYFRVIKKIEVDIMPINYFSRMVNCCKLITKECRDVELPIFHKVADFYKIFKKAASNAPEGVKLGSESFIYSYLKILFLTEMRGYNKCIDLISTHKQELHEMYKAIGELDTAICVLSFRKSLPFYCKPQFVDNNSVEFCELYHPLIAEPVANSGCVSTNSLITGSNASGKSSFIKAMAINGILSQTINTCTAQKYALRHTVTVSSMALRDDLQKGESYFIVEVKSIKRIFDLCEKYPCTCYIDEILRGTNTIERIAASTAVLRHIEKKDCLCIVASHDGELTSLLNYENFHFSEQITEDDVVFDYKLKQGPSTSRNAIKLLSTIGFDSEIISAAECLAAEMTETTTV